MKNRTRIGAWLLLAGCVALSAAPRALALQVTPTYQIFTLEAGDKVEGQLTLTNTDDTDIEVTPETKEWFVLPENKDFKVKDWLEIHETRFKFKPGEVRTIKFTAHAPKKATGELVGMLSFLTKSPVRTMITFRLSVGIYVAIKGTEKISAEIPAISVMPSTNSLTAGLMLLNTGNVHIRPHGYFYIKDMDNEPMYNIEINATMPSYPGRPTPYSGTVKDTHIPPGRYIAEVSLYDTDRQVDLPTLRKKFVVTKEGKVELK